MNQGVGSQKGTWSQKNKDGHPSPVALPSFPPADSAPSTERMARRPAATDPAEAHPPLVPTTADPPPLTKTGTRAAPTTAATATVPSRKNSRRYGCSCFYHDLFLPSLPSLNRLTLPHTSPTHFLDIWVKVEPVRLVLHQCNETEMGMDVHWPIHLPSPSPSLCLSSQPKRKPAGNN